MEGSQGAISPPPFHPGDTAEWEHPLFYLSEWKWTHLIFFPDTLFSCFFWPLQSLVWSSWQTWAFFVLRILEWRYISGFLAHLWHSLQRGHFSFGLLRTVLNLSPFLWWVSGTLPGLDLNESRWCEGPGQPPGKFLLLHGRARYLHRPISAPTLPPTLVLSLISAIFSTSINSLVGCNA